MYSDVIIYILSISTIKNTYMNLENVQVFKNIIKYLFQRCTKTTFKHDFWLNSVSWNFPIISTLEEQRFQVKRVYIKPRIPPGPWEPVSSDSSAECGNAQKEHEKNKFPSIVNIICPWAAGTSLRFVCLLSLFTKLFHMIHLIIIIALNTMNGVINLILQMRKLMLSEVKWLTHVQTLVQQRQAKNPDFLISS